MSRAILFLVFVAIVASIGQGRVIEKRSPGGASDFADQIDEAVDLKAIGGHIDTAIDAVGDFGSDAIDWTKGAANDVEDAFDDAGSAIGDFFGGLGRKKRSSGDPEKDGPGVGSDIWDQIDKGSAAVGSFPDLISYGSTGDINQKNLGPFKNVVLEETRAYAGKALGKYYGNLLCQRFTSSSAHRTTNSKFQILAINFLIVYFLSIVTR